MLFILTSVLLLKYFLNIKENFEKKKHILDHSKISNTVTKKIKYLEYLFLTNPMKKIIRSDNIKKSDIRKKKLITIKLLK